MGRQTLPGATALLGPAARDTLAPAVARAGGHLLSARPTQVRHDPGRIVVRYAARVVWNGARRTETLGTVIDQAGLPDAVAVVADELGSPIGVWRYPHDPYLPGLPHAAYPERAAAILRHLGCPAQPFEITPLVYRPSRRAVLRVRTPRRAVYLKVVRAGEAAALRATHTLLGEHLRVARCLGWSDRVGLLVFEALPGTPMTRTLIEGRALPAPAAVAAIVQGLRRTELPRNLAAPKPDVQRYAELLQTAVPDANAQIDELVESARRRTSAAETTIHGDLHPGQLLVGRGVISGVVDLDGVRRGSAADDPANLIGHLLGLAHVRPAAAARIDDYRRQLTAVLAADLDPAEVSAAVTGVLLGLATGPFRRQERDWSSRTRGWLRLATTWSSAPDLAA